MKIYVFYFGFTIEPPLTYFNDASCNILTYISSINTWVSGDSPLAQLVKVLELVFISVCNGKAVSSRNSRTNQ